MEALTWKNHSTTCQVIEIDYQQSSYPTVSENIYIVKLITDSNGTLPPPLTAATLYRRLKPYAQNSEFSATDLFTGEVST